MGYAACAYCGKGKYSAHTTMRKRWCGWFTGHRYVEYILNK